MAPSKPAAKPDEPALVAVPDAPAETPEKESTVRQRLLGQTMIALREAHRAEFDQMAHEVFAKEGLVYKRRLSPQEQAAQKIRTLAKEAGLTVEIDVAEPAEG